MRSRCCQSLISSVSRAPRPFLRTAIERHGPSGQRRGLIGEILGVLTNPGETVRSLSEARKELEKAREDIREKSEAAQIPPKHTFSPLQGFFERPNELRAIEQCLSGVPSFNVLFGASSAGKTALLRQVLSRPEFATLCFDLRIAGFADLGSLHLSLSTQLEQFWTELSKSLTGYEDIEKLALAFKHARLTVERRAAGGGAEVKTSDIAHLLELFQSALLRYWDMKPKKDDNPHGLKHDKDTNEEEVRKMEALEISDKKIPVLFIDEAHRLPSLIKDDETMKVLLDACLVLTKQDRLCSVFMATSSPFFFQWLRQLNVLQHARVLSIGDTTREEAERYFKQRLLPDLPMHLQRKLDFDQIFDVLGGKLAHWQDYIQDFEHADGELDVRGCSHYTQAYALVRLHLIHASPGEKAANTADGGGTGFSIYDPLPSIDGAPPTADSSLRTDVLLEVLRALRSNKYHLSYFDACERFGVAAVDAVVHGKLCELRWTPTVSREDPPSFAQLSGERSRGVFHKPTLMPMTPVVGAAINDVLAELDKRPNESYKKASD